MRHDIFMKGKLKIYKLKAFFVNQLNDFLLIHSFFLFQISTTRDMTDLLNHLNILEVPVIRKEFHNKSFFLRTVAMEQIACRLLLWKVQNDHLQEKDQLPSLPLFLGAIFFLMFYPFI